jgi:hypothetical protein
VRAPSLLLLHAATRGWRALHSHVSPSSPRRVSRHACDFLAGNNSSTSPAAASSNTLGPNDEEGIL